jgi:hypothetical protein
VKHKVTCTGLIFVFLGCISWIVEQASYGGLVDENGVLQESLFLPLTFLLAIPGVALLVVAGGFALRRRVSNDHG